MQPIIILDNPFQNIARIDIFSPEIDHDRTVNFLVKINGDLAKFTIFEDDKWVSHKIAEHYGHRVAEFIYQQIKWKYLGEGE